MLNYYRDGQLWNSRLIDDPMFSLDPLPLALGGQGANVENWRGHLSDVQLYESALTQEEVQSVMSGTALTGKNLYGHWKLDDGPGAGDVVADSGPRGEEGLIFDWDVDGLAADGTVWVNDLKNTWIGDANLDAEFNSSDMVQVFAGGKYELEEIAGWEEGDWNGNQRFESGDMVAAFVAGGYEKGPRVAPVGAVPEPTGLVLLLLGLIGLARSSRRR